MSASAALGRATSALDRGGLVVYPTDTLLGLGARADRPAAVARLARLKGRPEGLPLSVALSSTEEIDRWAQLVEGSRALVRRMLPGPYTLLVPARPSALGLLAPGIVGPTGTLGLRVPDHPIARELARRSGPIVSTSANLHGEPPMRSAAEARAAWGAGVDVYLEAVPPPSGRASEILDLTGRRARRVPRGGR